MLDKDEQARMLEQWVNAGGGRSSFIESEADRFLDFVADHLPDPSHELTICRMEQGLLCARRGADSFDTRSSLEMNRADCAVCRGRNASVVVFHAEPSVLLSALGKKPLPPLSPYMVSVAFAPGLDRFFRIATAEEVKIWERLGKPASVHDLLKEGHRQKMIETMFLEGFVDQSK
jgi:hypothetical protein